MRYHAPYAATIEVSLRAFGPAMAEVGGLHHLAPRLLHLHGEPSNCSIQQFLKGFMECIQKASCDVKDWSLRGFSQLECGCYVESSSSRFFLSFLHDLRSVHFVLHFNVVDILKHLYRLSNR